MMKITRLSTMVVVGAAVVLAATGLAGCSTTAPVPAPSGATPRTICAQPDWTMSDAVQQTAPDYAEPVSFFDPFSVFDLLGFDDPADYQTPVVRPGTDTVGVVSVTPVADKWADLPGGVVGFDARTGRGLWGLQFDQLGGIYSNGTDRLVVAHGPGPNPQTITSVDAATGRIIAATGLPALSDNPAYSNGILGMAGHIIVFTDGKIIRGLTTEDMSTTIWRHPALDQRNGDPGDGGLLGQCILTADGYARIDNGMLAGFGADTNDDLAYVQAADGSIFRWTLTGCPASGQGIDGCLRDIDPATDQPAWNTSIPVNCMIGSIAPVISQQVVMLRCGGTGSYQLSDGQPAWDFPSGGTFAVSGISGQYAFINNGTLGDCYAIQTTDGTPQPCPGTDASTASGTGSGSTSTGHGSNSDTVSGPGMGPGSGTGSDSGSGMGPGSGPGSAPGAGSGTVPGGQIFAPNTLYTWTTQSITAYDATTSLNPLWTVPMPATANGEFGSSSGHLAATDSTGQVWVAKPTQV